MGIVTLTTAGIACMVSFGASRVRIALRRGGFLTRVRYVGGRSPKSPHTQPQGMSVPPILNTPEGLALVTLLVVAGLYWQRVLGWHDYQQLHRVKVLLAPVVDAHTKYFILSEKEYRNKSPEFLGTRDASVREVFERLTATKHRGSPHLISSVKVREHPSQGRQYSAAHVVWTHDDGTQTECYGFDNGDDTSDWYVHHEESVADADGHLSEGGVPGDPKGVVREALGVERGETKG